MSHPAALEADRRQRLQQLSRRLDEAGERLRQRLREGDGEPAHRDLRPHQVLAVGAVRYAVESAGTHRWQGTPPLPVALRHHGHSFRVVDLRRLFGLPPRPASRSALLLVERPGAGVALVADELVGEQALDLAAAQPLPAIYGARERCWFRGLLPQSDGQVLVLLRPEALLA